LVGGLIIGFGVSFFLLRFFDKISTKNPILKSVILSFAAIVVIEVLSTFGNPSNAYVYLLIDTVMNIPRILALGIVIGYLYKKGTNKPNFGLILNPFRYKDGQLQNLGQKLRKWPLTVNFSEGTQTVSGVSPVRLTPAWKYSLLTVFKVLLLFLLF
jgi:hypothetical protein